MNIEELYEEWKKETMPCNTTKVYQFVKWVRDNKETEEEN